MPSATVSVCIITYNEEKNIRACLESVRWADEIIVVDSFSNDATVSICSEYTHNVMQRSWPGHVEQKNFAIDQAIVDWI
ncbi:MAG TPA: glycosyltransferase, partial [Thermodesulfobacteriota bacterium]|nr:glycosyltransferase [Thermodesulfobacteriota bacterium]